ncbi:MAG: hypothetical protein L6N96_03045 [Candidatus Methylarchaceae archaeon HK02M2]|nr:hypothetical protein [Candidatus Methylarchaceae archaeon HK02M2]
MSVQSELQLRRYAIACIRSLDLDPQKAIIHHLDITEGKNMKSEVDISTPILDKVGNELAGNIFCIIHRSFNPKPSEKC